MRLSRALADVVFVAEDPILEQLRARFGFAAQWSRTLDSSGHFTMAYHRN